MDRLAVSVKRALFIQEQRQAEYKKLRKSHDDYASQATTLQEYQQSIAEITTSFQALSQEMIELSKVFRDHPLPQAAEVLDKIQAKEKEKLQLVAEWQVTVAEQRAEDQDERNLFEDAAHDHRQKELRQKLAAVEGGIADLVADLRYECEHVLLPAVQS